MSSENLNDWTPRLENLLSLWIRQCRINEIIYQKNSSQLKKLHYLVGYPSTIIGGFTATTLFITYSDPCETSSDLLLGMGVISAIGTILNAILFFGEFNVRSKDSHDASSDYSSQAREGEMMLNIERKEARENGNTFMRGFKEAFDRIYDAAPTLLKSHADKLPQFDVMVRTYQQEEQELEHMEEGNVPPQSESGLSASQQSGCDTIIVSSRPINDAERELLRRIAAQQKRLEDLTIN